MVPASLVAAVQELGWLAVLLSTDSALATEPDEALRLLDGLIVPAWEPRVDRNADFSRRLADAAQVRGLPVVRLDESLLAPDSTVADYRRAIGELFHRDARLSERRLNRSG
jgi:hypothetical protein